MGPREGGDRSGGGLNETGKGQDSRNWCALHLLIRISMDYCSACSLWDMLSKATASHS